MTLLIPTYNRAVLLRQAIDSALAQTYDNLEVLILDDSSTDNTAAVAAEYKSKRRVRYVRHCNNLGIAGNWAAGIEMARGEYFCILHDDDTFEPEFVEKLVHPLIEDESLVFSFCDHSVMNEDGTRNPIETEHASRAFKRSALSAGYIGNWSSIALVDMSVPVGATMFRRGMISPDFIDARAKGAIDGWLFYQCARLNKAIYFVPDRLMNYRLHTGGMSQQPNPAMEEGHIHRYRHILDDPKMAPLHDSVRGLLGSALSRCGILYLTSGDRGSARAALSQALALDRSNRTYLAYGLACSGRLGSTVARAIVQQRTRNGYQRVHPTDGVSLEIPVCNKTQSA